jgi:dihydropteroate synthase-like protein
MRVLAVTGRLAEGLVRDSVGDRADILVLDTDIAAFITPQMLMGAAPQGYDLIMVPGATTADFSRAENALRTTIRLGPKNAADLGFVLDHLGEVELSKTVPACVLLDFARRSQAKEALALMESRASFSLLIRGLKIGQSSRMKVLAEIVDSTRMAPEELCQKISYYQSQGADMIDLGVPLDARPSELVEALRVARGCTELPLSVDTLNPEIIMAGIESGADLILSLDGNNIPDVGLAVAKAGMPAVVIPGPGRIEENISAAKSLGIEVIADPVLSPPLMGMAGSICNYLELRKSCPSLPLFFGVGNATELIDADSQGANAILTSLGSEVGASILFTPEYSQKARGSIRELRTASEMMALASDRKSPPKDLGLDLLILKEKRRYPEGDMPNEPLEAYANRAFQKDPAGSISIWTSGGMIVARHQCVHVVGESARDLLSTLIDQGLVTRLDHAGYLGRELQKAEIALALGRSYSQDEPIFSEKS